MEIKTFLNNFIEDKSDYDLTEEDKKTIEYEGILKFVSNKLNSSKYRASATSDDYQQKVLDKITLCINHEMPITISLPFGATKNPYLPTAPGIDWAEAFNIAYIRNYLKPIAKAYKYGVSLEYISVAVFEEKVNKIPRKDTDIYDKQFTGLIKFYQNYLPTKFTLKYSRVEDGISREKIEKQIDIKKTELRKSWDKQPKEKIEYKLLKAKRNCVYDPDDKNLDQIILDSALGHDAFCSECWTTEVGPWDKKHMITLGHNYTKGWAIHVKSAPGSSVNFWSGIGLLMERNDGFVPTVLSPLQFQDSKNKIRESKCDLFDEKFPNLQNIIVV